jgi:hypothetical protein
LEDQMKKLFLLLIAVSFAAVSAAAAQTIQHGVLLTCTSVSGTTYSFYRATVSGAEAQPPLASALPTCQYDDLTAVIGTKYYYTVTGTVGGVQSRPSLEVSAQIPVPPDAPLNPAANPH